MTQSLKSEKLPTDKQIEHIIDYIKGCGIQKTHRSNIVDLYEQAACVASKTLGLQSLIDLASLSCISRQKDENLPYIPSILAENICNKCMLLSKLIEDSKFKNDKHDILRHRHILKLLLWIESYSFTNEEQKASVVNSARILTKQYLNWVRQSKTGPIPREYLVGIALHFLYLDVYDDTILDAIYTDERILEPAVNKDKSSKQSVEDSEKNTFQVKERIVYENENDLVIIIRRAFLMINGILEVNYPSYTKAGRTINPSHIRYLNNWFGK